ncbi:MAG: ORF6N domain-containing protein [Treponema sp.]|nr:ORF6N domain-containing protein [Treponema sp.]
MEKEAITPVLIESKIFLIRGKQVMIDRNLAELYGVETKRITEAVKRNIERFPEEFRFQLTAEEMNELVANCDRFKSLKHSSVASYVFTEQDRKISRIIQVLNNLLEAPPKENKRKIGFANEG